MKNDLIIAIAISVVIGGGLGFFAGTKYQQNQTLSRFNQFNGGTPGGNFRMGNTQNGNWMMGIGTNRQGFRPVNGEIINSDATSITVKMPDGSSRIVLISNKTTINKALEATLTDLKVGEKVAAFGTDNSDGSMTAQNIQLNPITRDFQEVQNPGQN